VEGGEKKMAIVSGGELEVCDRSIDGADDDILFPVFSLSFRPCSCSSDLFELEKVKKNVTYIYMYKEKLKRGRT
jgi:hypothetical protein